MEQLVVDLFRAEIDPGFRHPVDPDHIIKPVLGFDQLRTTLELVGVLYLKTLITHPVGETMEGGVGMGNTGEDHMVGLEFEFIKFHPSQQQAKPAAVVPFLHGLHGREDFIGRKRVYLRFLRLIGT